jgi:hypothetical protein
VTDLIPIPLYTRAAEQTIATLKRSPWLVVVPMIALGLGALADWLLAPLSNLGLIIAAPIKGLLWSVALHVWRRTLVEGTIDRADLEADLAARARSLPALFIPLLFGTLAFLTLAWGGALAGLFVLVAVVTPMLEAGLLGSQSGLGTFFRLHGKAWAVSQLAITSVLVALWLVVVMVAAVFHLLAGEVASAVIGGPLLAIVWLVRGHAWFAVDAPVMAPPPPRPARRPAPAKLKAAPAAKKPPPKAT